MSRDESIFTKNNPTLLEFLKKVSARPWILEEINQKYPERLYSEPQGSSLAGLPLLIPGKKVLLAKFGEWSIEREFLKYSKYVVGIMIQPFPSRIILKNKNREWRYESAEGFLLVVAEALNAE